MAHILDAEIRAFENLRQELEQHHMGKFVVMQGGILAGVYDTFDAAAKAAVGTLTGPYLIRQVGATSTMAMPASVAFRPVYAAS